MKNTWFLSIRQKFSTLFKGVSSLQYIGEFANFRSLKTARGLNSPQTVISDLYFNNLIDASDLTSLQDISNINISPYVDLQQIVKNNQTSIKQYH